MGVLSPLISLINGNTTPVIDPGGNAHVPKRNKQIRVESHT